MSGLIPPFLILLTGVAMGLFFYFGLWITIRALPTTRHPVVLTLGSFWLRGAVVIAGFVLTTARRWQNALFCLAGFVLARVMLARWFPQLTARKGAV